MKKEILATCIALFLSGAISAYADKTEVSLNGDWGTVCKPGHPSGHPTVTYDDDEITIKSDSTINDLTVVVRDQYGQVLHSSTISVSQDGTII